MNLPVEIIALLVGIVFGAGGLVAVLRVVQKDVNGLGRKVGEMERASLILLMTLVPEKDRKLLAGILLKR